MKVHSILAMKPFCGLQKHLFVGWFSPRSEPCIMLCPNQTLIKAKTLTMIFLKNNFPTKIFLFIIIIHSRNLFGSPASNQCDMKFVPHLLNIINQGWSLHPSTRNKFKISFFAKLKALQPSHSVGIQIIFFDLINAPQRKSALVHSAENKSAEMLKMRASKLGGLA